MEKETYAPKKHIVGIGFVCAEKGNAEFTSYAIGSCIALCLYDPYTTVGAMAHILLPSQNYTGHENNEIDISTKYADHALRTALEKMCELGADKRSIVAAVIGGAEMYPHGNSKILNIGKMNTESVADELKRNRIPIAYSELGGEKSRTVVFRIPGNGFEYQIIIKSPPSLK